jgi:hypothetical protein
MNAAKEEILIASGSQGVLDAVGKVLISNSISCILIHCVDNILVIFPSFSG